MDDALQNYLDVRTANGLDIPVAQVQAVNSLLRYADEDEPIEVEKRGASLHVTWTCEEVFRMVNVEPDGYLDWTCNGAFPEIAHWNKPRGSA